MNHCGSWNPSNIATSSNSPPIPSFFEALESSYAQRNSNFVVSKPSGVGLHLNSSVNAEPVSCGVTASTRSNCNPLTQASVAGSSSTSLSPQIVKPLDNDVLLKQSESGDTAQELQQLIPKKKRKKAWSTNYSDGCKRCNCKKTSCLKLYCDCFAAGIYCAESCACQGCFNRLEYEDTVLGIRQQIESRNPLAFAPKIEDGSHSSPASGRHKRGCNCKKSMCLKKYCECYQANVGCSDGCRCEGCKNVYGQKEEYSTINNAVSKGPNNESLEGASDEKLKIVANTNGFLQTELCNFHSLIPSLQGSANSARSPRNSHSQPSDEFSPLFDGHGMHHLAAVPDRFSMAMASSASSVSSLCWHSSPIIPMTQFSNVKQVMGSDNTLYDVPEDDTPEILRNTFMHSNNVKVRSPNKKRVSPPWRLA